MVLFGVPNLEFGALAPSLLPRDFLPCRGGGWDQPAEAQFAYMPSYTNSGELYSCSLCRMFWSQLHSGYSLSYRNWQNLDIGCRSWTLGEDGARDKETPANLTLAWSSRKVGFRERIPKTISRLPGSLG